MPLCEYGCGQEAVHQFKNGKWCCSEDYRSCPEIIKKRTFKGKNHPMYGRKHTDEAKESISKKNKGRLKGDKNPMSNPNYRKKVSEALKGRNDYHCKGNKHWMRSGSDKAKRIIKLSKERFTGNNNPSKKPEIKKLLSELAKKRFKGKGNPMYGSARFGKLNPMWGKKQSDKCKEINRQRMLNGGAAYIQQFISNPSKPQVELFNLCQEVFPYPILNYPSIYTNHSIDIAVPQLSLAIEYDGSYWHQDNEKDRIRQDALEEQGWKFIRYTDRIPSKEELLFDCLKACDRG